jgi:hypothetical protein
MYGYTWATLHDRGCLIWTYTPEDMMGLLIWDYDPKTRSGTVPGNLVSRIFPAVAPCAKLCLFSVTHQPEPGYDLTLTFISGWRETDVEALAVLESSLSSIEDMLGLRCITSGTGE